MAKRPLVHCRICKQAIDRDAQNDWIMPQEKWYYHQACYDDFARKKRQKDKEIEDLALERLKKETRIR